MVFSVVVASSRHEITFPRGAIGGWKPPLRENSHALHVTISSVGREVYHLLRLALGPGPFHSILLHSNGLLPVRLPAGRGKGNMIPSPWCDSKDSSEKDRFGLHGKPDRNPRIQDFSSRFPGYQRTWFRLCGSDQVPGHPARRRRSEEHTSELQS